MNIPAILQQLQQRFGDAIVATSPEAIDPGIEVAPQSLHEICLYLRDDPALRFNYLNCISGVDYCEPDAKKAAKVEWKPHLEVLYHMTSMVHKHRLVVRVSLPRWKEDVEGLLPELPTVSDIWNTANWHEREVYDLCGVRFLGHPDFRRILCPEDWVGHPLRKDYQMPLEYHGIRGR
jgi:NADH-quinone oxidoreductase subunit C